MSKCFKCGNEMPKMVMEPNKLYCGGHYESSEILQLKRSNFSLIKKLKKIREDEFGLLRCAERMLEFSKLYPYCDEKIIQAQTLERMLEKAIRKENEAKSGGNP